MGDPSDQHNASCDLCGTKYAIHDTNKCAYALFKTTPLGKNLPKTVSRVEREVFNQQQSVNLWCFRCRRPCFYCKKNHRGGKLFYNEND